MPFDVRSLDYAFDPLKVVDVKTLSAVAQELKKSKDKSKRAIGVFLDRINRLRTADRSVSTGSVDVASGVETRTTSSDVLKSTGLKDLNE